MDRWRTWRVAMTDALYGPDGFYVAAGAPARNFRTAAHASPQWATAIHTLAAGVYDALGSPTSFAVVDVGSGGGELVAALAPIVPSTWDLVGVDLAPRPSSLPDRVSWLASPPSGVVGLIIANELLDVVPVDVAELADDGPRIVEVADDGDERLGDLAVGRDAEWLAAWWPLAEVGDRAEIGWPRDDAWHGLSSSLDRGLAVAVDYAASPAHDLAGTLTGYRDGRQVQPVPDGSCDITAHMLVESLVEAGDVVLSQREALRLLGISGRRPAYGGDPGTYLAALSSVGEAAELLDPSGLGGFTWIVRSRGIPSGFPPSVRT